MLQEIKKFVFEKEKGLFLLDSPTGFGKTTAVVNFIKQYIRGELQTNKKRIFFITNLKLNLPWKDLKDAIGDDLFYKNCLVLESYADTIIKQWNNVEIDLKLIKNSEEYSILNSDIELLKITIKELGNGELKPEERKRKEILKKNIESKIQEKSEPQFRELIKKNYFYNKSIVEKNKFINNHLWFKKLYPSSVMENYKVIFMTTAKFFNPIDCFHRMPFFLADDGLLSNAIVFIDEFDSTKNTVLSNIIQQDLKVQVDLVKLFLNIYYSVDNLVLPKRMLKVSDFLQKRIDEGNELKTPQELIDGIREEFKKKYNLYKFSMSIKSEDLDKSKTFLFYDGRSFTIVNDNSKKNIYIKEDDNAKYIKLYAGNSKFIKDTQLKTLINDLNYSINYFIRGIVYLADNFKNLKNQNLERNSPKYTIEESVMSILSLLNISEEFTQIIFQRIIEYYGGKNLTYKIEIEEDNFMEKGFNFTEIEDDRYHDLQSKFHAFYFHTTPEAILIRMANKGSVIGVSATASLDTVVGNYNIKYLKKKLKDDYYETSKEGKRRIDNEFNELLKVYDEENIDIKVVPVDAINEFSIEEKIMYIINNKLGLKEESKKELIDEYNKKVHDEDKGEQETESKKYYQFIKYKIAYCYKYFLENDNIKSFLCFNNFSINNNSSIKEKELTNLFKIIAYDNGFDYIKPLFIFAANFMQSFEETKKKLSEGCKVFWISTYKTIGSGKNIQYKIPECVRQNVIMRGDKTRDDKDFDAIYLCTPTNLIKKLDFNSDSKYYDLAVYLFQQEYLKKNEDLSYQEMKQNVIRGFKKIFYNVEDIYYSNNGDMLVNSAQIIIQAIGRICR